MSLLNLARSSLARRAWTVAKAALSWPARIVEARRLMRQVSGMSDHELRDIGLTRHDVWDATALPRSADPSRLFQQRADERRGAGRHHLVNPDVAAPAERQRQPGRVVVPTSVWLSAGAAVPDAGAVALVARKIKPRLDFRPNLR